MLKNKTFILFIVLVLLSSFSAAITGRPVAYYGPKKAGMGGCGVAIIDKRESLYYNPAAVSYIEHALLLPFIQGTTGIGVDVISNLQKLQETSAESSDDNTEKSLDTIKKIIPSKLGLGYTTAGHFIGTAGTTSYGLGGYINGKLGAKLLNRVSPRVEAIGYLDIAFPTLTIARPIKLPETAVFNNLYAGLTIKNINRTSLWDPIDNGETFKVEILDLISEDIDAKISARSAQGVGFDLGFLADINTRMGPGKIGLAFQNINTTLIGKTYEDITSENGKIVGNYKEDIPTIGTIGFAVESSIPVLNIVFPNATYTADLDFISPDKSIYKKIHLGMEQTYLGTLLALRLGLNQGYPTMGIDLNLAIFHLGLTYYTEEFGKEIGDNPQSFYLLNMGFYW